MPWNRVHDIRRGPSFWDDSDLEARRLNLSFVLHEPSTSRSVVQMAARRASGRRSGGGEFGRWVGFEDLVERMPDGVLTAHIGLPSRLTDAVARLPRHVPIHTVDAVAEPTTERAFFRAPASLALPRWPLQRLIAAAAVVRPGGDNVELVASDAFAWPRESAAALRALERIMLAHVDQWRPPRALWSAPAEELLPEVLTKRA